MYNRRYSRRIIFHHSLTDGVGGNKPAVYQVYSECINPCVLYRPSGYENVFKELLARYSSDDKVWLFKSLFKAKDSFDIIEGYSSFKYFKHMAASIMRSKVSSTYGTVDYRS